MTSVVGIRFKTCGKIYDFETDGLSLRKGDTVVVESDFGLSLGKVAVEKHDVEEKERELKKILRIATEEDFQTKEENRELEAEAFSFCAERIMARGLPMKPVYTETTLDRKRIIFYFAAEKRIDFRELVKDLAQKFKTRIELRQIGVRDEAKMLGGIGICGRQLCCRTFLMSFEPISIKMAKKQDLVLNANKLSGICGRLMCCLSYEYTEGRPHEESVEAVAEGALSPEMEALEEAEETTKGVPAMGEHKTNEAKPPETPHKRHKRRDRRRRIKKGLSTGGRPEEAKKAPPPTAEPAPQEQRSRRRRRRRPRKKEEKPQ